MSNGEYNTHGMDDRLQEMLQVFRKMKRHELQRLGYKYLREVIKLTPVDTANLKRRISVNPVSDEEVQVGTNVHYAPHVEYGHRIVDRNGKVHGYKKGAFMFKKGWVNAKPKLDREIKSFYDMLDDILEG